MGRRTGNIRPVETSCQAEMSCPLVWNFKEDPPPDKKSRLMIA